jgi:hypothetical protein
MKNQSAVDWLVEKIKLAKPDFKFDALIRESKAMEKEQIIDAYKQCENSNISWQCDGAQDYYKENYGK